MHHCSIISVAPIRSLLCTYMQVITIMHPPQKNKKKKGCNVRESNPGLPRGRREFYHWTTDAAWKFTFPGVKKLFKDCFIPTQWEKWSLTKIASPAGNWTRVSRVTGGDTHHYTTKDWAINSLKINSFVLKRLPVLDLIEILASIWYKNKK